MFPLVYTVQSRVHWRRKRANILDRKPLRFVGGSVEQSPGIGEEDHIVTMRQDSSGALIGWW